MRSKLAKFIQASTLMESLVALAITTLMIWFVFKAIPTTITPVNPERKLEALFVADSLANSFTLAILEQNTVDTMQVKGFNVEIGVNKYDTISSIRLLSIKVKAKQHTLAERTILIAYSYEED